MTAPHLLPEDDLVALALSNSALARFPGTVAHATAYSQGEIAEAKAQRKFSREIDESNAAALLETLEEVGRARMSSLGAP